MKVTATIAHAGFGLSGDIGGLPRTTYYTPDGRVIKAFPNMREFVKRQNGEVVGTGTRDANLDKGWLLSPPQVPKLFCPTCDRWHDTEAGVNACKRAQAKFIAGMARKTKQEETDKVAELETKVAQLMALVNKLTEGGNGHRQVLQPETTELSQVPRTQRVRKAKAGV